MDSGKISKGSKEILDFVENMTGYDPAEKMAMLQVASDTIMRTVAAEQFRLMCLDIMKKMGL